MSKFKKFKLDSAIVGDTLRAFKIKDLSSVISFQKENEITVKKTINLNDHLDYHYFKRDDKKVRNFNFVSPAMYEKMLESSSDNADSVYYDVDDMSLKDDVSLIQTNNTGYVFSKKSLYDPKENEKYYLNVEKAVEDLFPPKVVDGMTIDDDRAFQEILKLKEHISRNYGEDYFEKSSCVDNKMVPIYDIREEALNSFSYLTFNDKEKIDALLEKYKLGDGFKFNAKTLEKNDVDYDSILIEGNEKALSKIDLVDFFINCFANLKIDDLYRFLNLKGKIDKHFNTNSSNNVSSLFDEKLDHYLNNNLNNSYTYSLDLNTASEDIPLNYFSMKNLKDPELNHNYILFDKNDKKVTADQYDFFFNKLDKLLTIIENSVKTNFNDELEKLRFAKLSSDLLFNEDVIAQLIDLAKQQYPMFQDEIVSSWFDVSLLNEENPTIYPIVYDIFIKLFEHKFSLKNLQYGNQVIVSYANLIKLLTNVFNEIDKNMADLYDDDIPTDIFEKIQQMKKDLIKEFNESVFKQIGVILPEKMFDDTDLTSYGQDVIVNLIEKQYTRELLPNEGTYTTILKALIDEKYNAYKDNISFADANSLSKYDRLSAYFSTVSSSSNAKNNMMEMLKSLGIIDNSMLINSTLSGYLSLSEEEEIKAIFEMYGVEYESDLSVSDVTDSAVYLIDDALVMNIGIVKLFSEINNKDISELVETLTKNLYYYAKQSYIVIMQQLLLQKEQEFFEYLHEKYNFNRNLYLNTTINILNSYNKNASAVELDDLKSMKSLVSSDYLLQFNDLNSHKNNLEKDGVLLGHREYNSFGHSFNDSLWFNYTYDNSVYDERLLKKLSSEFNYFVLSSDVTDISSFIERDILTSMIIVPSNFMSPIIDRFFDLQLNVHMQPMNNLFSVKALIEDINKFKRSSNDEKVKNKEAVEINGNYYKLMLFDQYMKEKPNGGYKYLVLTEVYPMHYVFANANEDLENNNVFKYIKVMHMTKEQQYIEVYRGSYYYKTPNISKSNVFSLRVRNSGLNTYKLYSIDEISQKFEKNPNMKCCVYDIETPDGVPTDFKLRMYDRSAIDKDTFEQLLPYFDESLESKLLKFHVKFFEVSSDTFKEVNDTHDKVNVQMRLRNALETAIRTSIDRYKPVNTDLWKIEYQGK